ncbi:hypothetical protein [Microcella sp.]|uniref:hypothetical protein n=1 Tax=Microcella sp. TaxID=1913979 RepID=UPI002568E0F7|nr:hypothetical protein [Microcella sp.]MBX9471596.1 hypothetical protein [Microcella sp.]
MATPLSTPLTTQQRIDAAPLPSERELRRRRNPFLQLWPFLRLNVSMFMLARRQHD